MEPPEVTAGAGDVIIVIRGRERAAVTVVRITEVPGGTDESFAARVEFGDGAGYEVTVAAPGDAAGERLLAWYFEEHLQFPSWTGTWSGRRS